MFLIAEITDKNNAARIRRELKKHGFSYNENRREWSKNCMTLRGVRFALPAARAIDGVNITKRTVEEMHSIINAHVSAA